MTGHKAIKAPVDYRRLAFDFIDSTNSEAIRQAQAGADEGLWVTSKTQGSGRGRRGRNWSSLDGNLFATLLLRPDVPPFTAANISFVAALAVHDCVASCVSNPDDVRVKWPNDLLISGAKVSGILLESSLTPNGHLDHLVIGIGLNIHSAPSNTPYQATSLRQHGCMTSAHEMMDRLEQRFAHWYGLWCSDGFEVIRMAWMQRTLHIGTEMTVKFGNSELVGQFHDLAANGALVLDVSGKLREIHAGEVFPTHFG